jgi:chemotaxis protein MotA
MSSIIKTLKSTKFLFTAKPYQKKDYLELLLFSFNAFKLMKIKGMLAIEAHIENPQDSELFKRAPVLSKDMFCYYFVTDNLRLMTMGMDNPHQFGDIIEAETETYKQKIDVPGHIFTGLGDALPALGIVAAVLGVIITMKSILEPPDVLGALIAAALVGTFIGVLFAYGIFGPIGHFLTKYAYYQFKFVECLKTGFITYLNDNPPIVVVEFMRKTIPEDLRPTFEELDAYINENAMKIMG